MAKPPAGRGVLVPADTGPPLPSNMAAGRALALRRKVSTILKFSGSVIALLSLIFTAYQFYEANRVKKRELAIAQVDKFQTFASSAAAQEIAKQSLNSDTKTYNLQNFSDKSSPQFRALLNYFNIINGISYLYNSDVVDKEYTMGNLLCPVVKQYRTFILAQTGGHGTVTQSINNAGVFKIGLFSQLDKMYSEWNASEVNGSSVDVRCASNWGI